MLTLLVWAVPDVCAQNTPSTKRIVFLTEPKSAYSDAIAAFRTQMRRSGVPIVEIELESRAEAKDVAAQIAREAPALVVTTGPVTARVALAATSSATVVSMMTPNAEDVLAGIDDPAQRRRLHIVTSDVAPADQIAFVRAVRRAPNCLAVLYSDRTKATAFAIKREADRNGILVKLILASRDDFLSAIDALTESNCDAVLMIPDTAVYNSAAVRRLLLWGARRRSAVFAFSSNLVRAGAFGGCFVDGGAVGDAAATLVRRILGGRQVGAGRVHYVDAVITAINERIAATIGTTIDESRLAGSLVRFAESD